MDSTHSLVHPGDEMNMDNSLLGLGATENCNDEEDAASETSTVFHGHEPFESFQNKVINIAAKHLGYPITDIKVERMKGGTYNRVIGVSGPRKFEKLSWMWFKSHLLRLFRTLTGSKLQEQEHYIVRIPRYTGSDTIDRDLEILKTVGPHLSLPIPEVVGYDRGSENLFEMPYMIQRRLPGHNLSILWETLNMKQKRSVVKQIIDIVTQIAAIEAPAGDIFTTADGSIRVGKFCVPRRGVQNDFFMKTSTWNATPQESVDHLIEQCERWREYQTAHGFAFHEMWDSFIVIAKALEALGFLSGPNVLVHGDLQPYNLLAEIRSSTDVEITGVIDWDFAVIAPEFSAYRAPFWLWTPDNLHSAQASKEEVANLAPQSDEDRELKALFMEHSSDKYKRFAFAKEAMLARRLFPILQKGVFSTWEVEEANNVIREWNELHPEDGVADTYSNSDGGSDEDSDEDSGTDLDDESALHLD